MSEVPLEAAIADVPAGAWAVGVSGGADSVALLSLLKGRKDLGLHVVHLDHQARGERSTEDARFVEGLAKELGLPCTSRRRDQVEAHLQDPPANLSARFRALRLALFGQVVREKNVAGVILAHHADDQAETILHRLVRGSGYAGLGGIARRAMLADLLILRPLLEVRRDALRDYLRQKMIAWREDESNTSEKYLRNRLRQELDRNPQLAAGLLSLGTACGVLRDWARSTAPFLAEQFRASELSRLPRILADESARRWLMDRGVPVDQIEPGTIERLATMARDAASAPRIDFPGGVHAQRRRGVVSARRGT